MVFTKSKSSANIDPTGQLLKPMWSFFYNLGLALIVGVIAGSVSAASFRSIDPDSSFGEFRFSPCTLDDSALQELARLSGSAFVSLQHFRNTPSQASIEALCQSSVSMDIGPLSLNAASVQLLVENEMRGRLNASTSVAASRTIPNGSKRSSSSTPK